MNQVLERETNRAGCLAKGVAYGGQIGQDLLHLAKRARAGEDQCGGLDEIASHP